MTEVRRVRLWQGKIDTEVEVAGSGPPLVFLHGPWGLPPNRGFLDLLALTHTVFAPKHPGTSRGDPEAVHQIDDSVPLPPVPPGGLWYVSAIYVGRMIETGPRLRLRNKVGSGMIKLV